MACLPKKISSTCRPKETLPASVAIPRPCAKHGLKRTQFHAKPARNLLNPPGRRSLLLEPGRKISKCERRGARKITPQKPIRELGLTQNLEPTLRPSLVLFHAGPQPFCSAQRSSTCKSVESSGKSVGGLRGGLEFFELPPWSVRPAM